VNAPSLRELVAAVAFDANRSVGGGLVSIELMRRRFTARGWIDAATYGLFIAVSRFTPGTVVLAYCVSLGFWFHRWPGALLALVVASVPGSLIVFALAVTLTRLDQYGPVRVMLAVGILVASALVLSSAWYLIRPFLDRRSGPRVAAVAGLALALVAFGATPVRVLLAAAVVSCIIPMGSLPQIRRDFIETHAAISDQQLSQAVLVGRATVGPMGAYVVAVGYFAGGWPGAVAGWLAMITPALAAIPMLALIQRWLHLPRLRAAVDGVIIASAVLLVGSGATLAIDAIRQLMSFGAFGTFGAFGAFGSFTG
jgi:chromate transport protein ChrA